MSDEHKLLILGALAGGALLAWRQIRRLRRAVRNGIPDYPRLGPTPSRSDADVRRLDESIAPRAPF